MSEVVDATRRTRLANERTFLAWLRSGLTSLAVAVGTGKIVPGVAHVRHWPFELLGGAFAVFGVALIVYGVDRYVRVERALAAGDYEPLERKSALTLAAIAAALGVGTLGFMFVH